MIEFPICIAAASGYNQVPHLSICVSQSLAFGFFLGKGWCSVFTLDRFPHLHFSDHRSYFVVCDYIENYGPMQTFHGGSGWYNLLQQVTNGMSASSRKFS
ncbi:hypothetical protein E2542_SST13225 [Spatholobus suberectus]|nr:hypothetical protein E2542_SST13225 [Spatholobus suberectus]